MKTFPPFLGINLLDDGKSMLHPNLTSRNTDIGNQVVTIFF